MAQTSDMPQIWSLSSTLTVKQGGSGLTFSRKNEENRIFYCHLTWNTLYKLMPEISAAVDDPFCSNKQWHLHSKLVVILGRNKEQAYLKLAIQDNDQQEYCLHVTTEEWKSLVAYADDINSNIKQHVAPSQIFTAPELVEQCAFYILLKHIEKSKEENCVGCRYKCGGQRDHMEGCFMEWTDAVSRYWMENLGYITPGIVERVYNKLREKLGTPKDPLSYDEIEGMLVDIKYSRITEDILETISLPDETVYYLDDIYVLKRY